ncbi:ankyrin repeat-containing domain protein [Apiospora kogelbergensis]|uniref:ankyrin repeat-containing domain protein n=1 Tax=Apiospora kogelbergensis TaxID=1337665 RepID=UPI00312D1933
MDGIDYTIWETSLPAEPCDEVLCGIKAHYENDGHQIKEAINHALQTKSRLQKKYRQPDVDTDRLYRTDVTHPLDDASYATSCSADTSALVMRRARGEDDDNPAVHYGLIASVNQLMKDAVVRDKLAREKGVLCFEVEAAGLTNHFPCLVIRGICDYSDTHKNKEWQGYAAMTAAAYAKDILKRIAPNKVEAERKIMNESLQVIRTSASDIKYGVEELQADGHLDKIRRWLSPLDPSTNLNKAREQHCRGTGQWFLDSDQYFKWKTDRHPSLWLNGIPGCGKTIFSSSVVADLEQSTASESLIYFYFGFNNIEKQSLEKAVRSLIAQLYYNFANGLLLWIKRIRESGVNVHMLVTSRPEYDIKAAIEGWACDDEIIPAQSSLVEADIEAYIKVRINQVDEWRAPPDIQKEIENTLVQKANGMFRWVSCQFDILTNCFDRPAIRRELANLPRTLDATYARILSRVQPEHMRYTTRLLQFLAYSERPLRLDEAVDALAVDASSQPRFDAANRTVIPEKIATYCAGLVILVKRQAKYNKITVTEIQRAHFSVQEYLTSGRLEGNIANELQETVARLNIVIVCLSYLLDMGYPYTISGARQEYPMVQYCARFWAQNAAVIEGSDKQVAIIKEYFSDWTTFEFGYQLYRQDRSREEPVDYEEPELLETGAEINAQGGHYGNALQAASFQGHEAIVRLMLENGADWTAPTQSELMPLHASLRYGHVSVIQLLLNKDSESCNEDNLGRSLLFYALQGGLEAFDLVRDRQMHINKTDHYGSTLLSVAVRYGHEELVNQLLVIPDIYCTLKDNFSRSALWWARRQGCVGIEGRLLEYTKTQDFDIGILVETNEPAEFSIESRCCGIVTVATSVFAWNVGGL